MAPIRINPEDIDRLGPEARDQILRILLEQHQGSPGAAQRREAATAQAAAAPPARPPRPAGQHSSPIGWVLAVLLVVAVLAGMALSGSGPRTISARVPVPTGSTMAVKVSVAPPPQPPERLQVEEVEDTAVSLSWEPVAGATEYRVLRNGAPVATVQDPRHKDVGLPHDFAVTYTVVSVGPGGESAPSSAVSARTTIPWSVLRERYANSVVKVTTYNTILGLPVVMTGGTGWFAPGGYVVTNWHVIRNARYVINVRVQKTGNGYEGQAYRAHVVATDPANDLALLRLDNGWAGAPIPLGDAAAPADGQEIAVLGHPALRQETMTTGKVQGRHANVPVRGVAVIPEMFAHDAGSIGGNSGSPVIDRYGKVVGVVSAGDDDSGNKGFAVPVKALLSLMGRVSQARR